MVRLHSDPLMPNKDNPLTFDQFIGSHAPGSRDPKFGNFPLHFALTGFFVAPYFLRFHGEYPEDALGLVEINKNLRTLADILKDDDALRKAYRGYLIMREYVEEDVELFR